MTCLNSQVKGNLKMDKEKNSWDRQQEETSKAYAAFCAYRDLGITRSVMRVVEEWDGKYGKRSILTRWSIQHDWVRRCREYDDFVEKERWRDLYVHRIEMTKRHIEQAKSLQFKGLSALDDVDPSALSHQDLLRYIKTGMELEKAVINYSLPDEAEMNKESKGDPIAHRISDEIMAMTNRLLGRTSSEDE